MRRALTALFAPQNRPGPAGASALSLLARLVFASVLLRFFLSSFATKIDGFGLSAGAYVQILPRQMEAAGYDPAMLSWPLHLVVGAGTLAELMLPLLVVLGLATRPAALAMLGFVAVMSLTDIYGHGIEAATIGHLFDTDPYGTILDQRLMWGFVLLVPLWLGGGAVSLDALLWPRLRRWLGRPGPGLAPGHHA
ncbi:DoxX family protein [Acidimangrovimonas pyrenivorans]|uniref:DoxX family protein n=1 Tax=Acidimangrovimonas pyrenivorans TaxID=2030798 RepID=A0ABV7AC04_9RHOB